VKIGENRHSPEFLIRIYMVGGTSTVSNLAIFKYTEELKF
jgi:hypothetical protein